MNDILRQALNRQEPASRLRFAEPPFQPAFNTHDFPELTYLLIAPHGVLYDDTPWWRRLLQMLSHLGLHTSGQLITALWQRDYYEDVCCGRREFFPALREFLTACGLRSGQVDEACAAGRMHWRNLELDLRPFPQTAWTLSRLEQQGWQMGLLVYSPLTAIETDEQLQRMGIDACFKNVLCSREAASQIGGEKFWQDIPHRLDTDRQRVAFVANDERFLHLAKAAGLTTLGFQCNSPCADANLHRMDEILMLPKYMAHSSAA